MIQHAPNARWRQADPLVLLAALGLTVYGILLVTSATWQYFDHPTLTGNSWFVKQTVFTLIGFIALAGCAMVHPRTVRAFAYVAYACGIGLLVLVILVGRGAEEYGAQRWIDLGFFQLQPSEPAKLALIVALARVLGGANAPFRAFCVSAALAALIVVMIFLQPDLGTALSVLAIWFGMVVLGGLPGKYVATILAVGVLSTPLVWLAMKDYMRARVLAFLNPTADRFGEGYNILQAQISIGSGGMWGKGLMQGTQTQLRFLRVSQSDFIASVLGEELGFIGMMVLFGLLLLLLFRLLKAYDLVEDPFGRMVAAGVASAIAFQAVANISSNVGLTPVVGIPLPFVSHGGSALITHLAALGLVQGALVRRRRYRFEA